MEIRLPHIKRYQRQLRDALLNPTLSEDQRTDIKDRLANLGKPRVYGSKPAHGQMASAPGATPPATSVVADPREQLLELTKKELLDLAEQEGVGPFKSKDTKEFIADAILAKRATRTT